MLFTRRTLVGSLLAAPVAWPLAAQIPGARTPSSSLVMDTCTAICNLIGLPNTLTIVESDNVESAEARMSKDKKIRYIVYNPGWLRTANLGGQRGVPAYVVLAHEIGHHLNGHTLDATPADVLEKGAQRFRPAEELAADVFSGGIVSRKGFALEQGLPVFESTDPAETETHAGRAERKRAFTAGWNAAPKSAVTCPPAGGTYGSGAYGYSAPSQIEAVNLYTHDDRGGRVLAEFYASADRRDPPGTWLEKHDGKGFATFIEQFRDPCGRIFLYDESRDTWVRLTPPATVVGIGQGAVAEGDNDNNIPETWRTLDINGAGQLRTDINAPCRRRG